MCPVETGAKRMNPLEVKLCHFLGDSKASKFLFCGAVVQEQLQFISLFRFTAGTKCIKNFVYGSNVCNLFSKFVRCLQQVIFPRSSNNVLKIIASVTKCPDAFDHWNIHIHP